MRAPSATGAARFSRARSASAVAPPAAAIASITRAPARDAYDTRVIAPRPRRRQLRAPRPLSWLSKAHTQVCSSAVPAWPPPMRRTRPRATTRTQPQARCTRTTPPRSDGRCATRANARVKPSDAVLPPRRPPGAPNEKQTRGKREGSDAHPTRTVRQQKALHQMAQKVPLCGKNCAIRWALSFVARRYARTKFTIVPGTTLSLRTVAPSSSSAMRGSARAAASCAAASAPTAHLDPRPHLAVDLHRHLDRLLDQPRRISRREIDSYVSVSSWPSRAHSSSAMCGASGATISVSGSATSRGSRTVALRRPSSDGCSARTAGRSRC